MPYKAPGIRDERYSWVLNQIDEAQVTLDQKIEQARLLPDEDLSKSKQIVRLNQLKREMNVTLGTLEGSVATWSKEGIPSLYESGWFIGGRELGSSLEFTLPHREAISILSYDAFDDVATKLQQVRQDFDDKIELQKRYQGLDPAQIAAIQEKSRGAVNQALLTGEADPKKVAKLLADDLWEDGVTIVDGGGNHWQMKNYTRMLVRTKSANAYNSGTLNKYVEEGVSRVRVYDGTVDDEECAEANGKVWTIKYALEHPIEHPNCRRAFSAVPGEGNVDDKADEETVTELVEGKQRSAFADYARAIRQSYRTGEFNVASSTAVFLTERVADRTGLPQPLVQFATQFTLGDFIKQGDAYFESLVDPVLFSLGLIDDIPQRAVLMQKKFPSQIVNELTERIMRGNAALYGDDVTVHPKVQKLLHVLDASSDFVLADAGYASRADSFYRRTTAANTIEMFGLLTGALKNVNDFGANVDAVYNQQLKGQLKAGLSYYRDAQRIGRRFNVEIDLYGQFVERRLTELGISRADYQRKQRALIQYLANGVKGVDEPMILARLMDPMATQADVITASVRKARRQLDEVIANLKTVDGEWKNITEIVARQYGRTPTALVGAKSVEKVASTIADDVVDEVTGTVYNLTDFRRATTGVTESVDDRTPASVADFQAWKAAQTPERTQFQEDFQRAFDAVQENKRIRAANRAAEEVDRADVVYLDDFRARKLFEEAGDPHVATGTEAATGTGIRTGTEVQTGTGAAPGTSIQLVPTGTGRGPDPTGGRKLTMGASSDAVDPLGNDDILDSADMNDVIGDLRHALDTQESSYSEEALDDFVSYLKEVRDAGEDGALFAELDPFIFPLHRYDDELGEKVKLSNWETLREVIEQLDGMTVDRATGLPVVKGKLVYPDTHEAGLFTWTMLAIEPEFWERTSFWQDVIGFSSDTGRVFRHLPPQAESTYDRGVQAARLWKNLTAELESVSDGVGSSTVHFGNLGRSLDEIYGAANVTTLAEFGTNGEIYKVTDDLGRVFLVKPLTSQHGGETHMISMSHGLTDLIAGKLDDVPLSIETRVIPLSETGGDYVAVMPYFIGDQISETLDVVTAEGLARMNLLDRLVLEADPNTGNTLVNRASRRAVSIDTETAFGFVQGVNPRRVDDYGIRGPLPNEYSYRNWKEWVQGGDTYQRATNAPPLVRVKLTNAEMDFIMPKSRREATVGNGFGGGLGREARNVGDGVTTGRLGMPMIVDDEALYLIGSRATMHQGDLARYMEVVHYATPKEAQLLDDMLNRRLHDEMVDVIQRRVDELAEPERVLFLRDWSDDGTIINGVQNAASRVDETLAARAAMLLDEGMVNTTGGVTKHIAADGTEYEIGKVVRLKRTTEADFGEPLSGTVLDIFDDASGRRQVVIAQGIGLGHSKGGLEVLFPKVGRTVYNRGMRTTVEAEQWSDEALAAFRRESTYVEDVKMKLDTKYRRRRVSKSPREVDVHTYDAEGTPLAFRTENVQVHLDKPGRSGLRFVSGDQETVVSWERIVDAGIIDNLVDAELEKMAPADRPLSVVVHFAPIRDNKGDLSFGYIKMDERQLHITVQSAAQLPITQGSTTGRTALLLQDGVDLDDVDALIAGLDWDSFTGVFRHELGHSADSGREATQRAAIARAVRKEINEMAPSAASEEALSELIISAKLIPEGYEPSQPNMSALAQLVEYRVELVEDVINTQLVNEAEAVLAVATERAVVPTWIQKAYKGIREGDADAHHEFVAELHAHILALGKGATAAEIQREIWSLFPNPARAKKLLSKSTIPLPRSWDPASDEFISWLHRYTGGDVIPRHRSTDTQFWTTEISGPVVAREISEALEEGAEQVGGTRHLTGYRPERGYSVARSGSEERINIDLDLTPEALEKKVTTEVNKFIKANRKRFLSEDDWYFGYWLAEGVDDETGEAVMKLYLDVTRVIDDEVDAAYFGYREQQRAMYRLHDGGHEIKLTDEVPDFKTWLETYHPELTENQMTIMLNRIGASRTKVNPVKDIIEVVDEQGKLVPISLEWMTEEQVARLQHTYDHEYWYAKTRISKSGKTKGQEVLDTIGSGSNKYAQPIKGKPIIVNKDVIKGNFERILQQALDYMGDGLVADSLPDVQWIARRKVTLAPAVAKSDEAMSSIRKAYKALDEYMVRAPDGFTIDTIPPSKVRLSKARNQAEVIMLQMGEAFDPDGKLGRKLIDLGFAPTSKYGLQGEREFFAESVLAALSGQASEDLLIAVIDLLPVNQSLERRHQMRFYQAWNGAFKGVAAETDIPVGRIVANAAILSAGMDATINREAAIWMARMVAENHQFTPKEMRAVRAYLDDQIKKRVDDLKPGTTPSQITAYENKMKTIRKLRRWRRALRNNMRLDEALEPDMGAWMLQGLTDTVDTVIVKPNGSTSKMTLVGRYGMPQVERGYSALTGAVSVTDSLGDTKIRSFYNNILDPKNWYGNGDVTIDFHMANMALWIRGMELPTANADAPRILGMAAGIRPLVGDALRELFVESEWATILDADSPAELQELLWEVWRLGFEKENDWWGQVPMGAHVPYDKLVKLGFKPPLPK